MVGCKFYWNRFSRNVGCITCVQYGNLNLKLNKLNMYEFLLLNLYLLFLLWFDKKMYRYVYMYLYIYVWQIGGNNSILLILIWISNKNACRFYPNFCNLIYKFTKSSFLVNILYVNIIGII